MGEVSMVARQTPNLKDRVRFLAPMPKWSCSLTVKHPAYTRHSLQIRERYRFESCQDYQRVSGEDGESHRTVNPARTDE